MTTMAEFSAADAGTSEPTRTHRRFLLIGLASIYAIAAVLAIQHQQREPSWDPALQPYVDFVEDERGLTFERPVEVRWADISAELAADFARERADESSDGSIDPFQEVYVLLGLLDVDPSVSFAESVDDTATSQAGAFYDPTLQTIVLPLGADPEALGFTIVHELTHAVQHQNGMLNWHQESPDSASTRTTLVEGDAERVAVAWFDQLDQVSRESFLDAIGHDGDLGEFEDVGNTFLETAFNASYALGLPAVQALIEAGGQDEIDRLLRTKTAGTSELVFDVLSDSPTSMFDARELIELPEGRSEPDGDIGVVVWFQALVPHLGTADTLDALIGYDDDAFVMYDSDDGRCANVLLTFDSPADTGEFVRLVAPIRAIDGLEIAAGTNRGAEFSVCTPIGDPNDQRFGTIMPIVVANEMALAHLQAGVASETARCAALAQAATIPADRPLSGFVGWDEVDRDAPTFLEQCGSAVFSPR